MTRKLLRCICMLLACVPSVWAALRVCGKCGYESVDDVAACAHCGAALPPPASAAPSSPVPERVPSLAFLPGGRVEEEIERSRQAYRDGNIELAWLFARNAAALESITDQRDPDRTALVAALLEKSRAAVRTLTRPCSDCGGTGRQFAQPGKLDGGAGSRLSRGKACETCSGTGLMIVPATVAETKRAKGAAQESYSIQQRGRQYWQIGNAWVPPEMRGSLSARQTAALLTVTASPCHACMGLGREDCSECAGTGRMPCPNAKCVKGWIHESRKGELDKSVEFKAKLRCPECNGVGVVPCETCRASGSLVCSSCEGRGGRALCGKCNGQGYAPCRRCKGAGEYRGAPCAECAAKGYTLCRGCSGDGREK